MNKVINELIHQSVSWFAGQLGRQLLRGGRNRIGRREKWPKKSWEEGEIEGKSREERENVG